MNEYHHIPQQPMTLGVIMDHIATINIAKDSTFAVLLEAQQRGWLLEIIYLEHLFVEQGLPYALSQRTTLNPNHSTVFQCAAPRPLPLNQLSAILMRKDPPVDEAYIYATQILARAEQLGSVVCNPPHSLLTLNEKLAIMQLPHCCAPTLISSQTQQIKAFLHTHEHIVIKPLNGMGGQDIFSLQRDDPNASVSIAWLTQQQRRPLMAQKYLSSIDDGDKRITLIDGQAIAYALARIPAPGEFRGNLAAGGRGRVQTLTARDIWICEQVAPLLKQQGILWAGIDVIGDYLTEINITSPTCIQEIEAETQLSISAQLLDAISARVDNKHTESSTFSPPPC